ncbi:MAG: hypothetical protein ABSB11_05465 [Sedimentisphaerales bacterium]|jgi:hypothetical protein
MRFDEQSKISEYLELIEAIKEQVDDPATALAILPEIRKDMRAAEMRQGNNHSSTADLPASEAQIAYIKNLGGHFPPQGLTRNQASRMIDELQTKKTPVTVEKMPMRRP